MRRVALFLLGLLLSVSPSLRAADGTDPAIPRAKAHVELGLAYLQGGRMAVALDEATSAMAADPNYAPAYNLAGMVNMFLRETDKAREYFEHALKLDPNDSEINVNYGWLLCQSGHEKDSFQYFIKAVKNPLYQTPTKAFFNAGICALKLDDQARAEDYFVNSIMADRNNTQALFRLADIKYRGNNLYDAKRFVNAVLAKVQDDPAPLWLALRIERKLGNRQAEQDYALELRRKFQGSPEYQAMIQGRFE